MLDALFIVLEDPTPDPTEVKAGPLGGALFVFLILMVVVLAFSLVKQLRKAQAAKDAGVYGDDPEAPETPDGTDARRDDEPENWDDTSGESWDDTRGDTPDDPAQR